MFTLLIFIGVLALLVFVHEFGHFFAAKRFGCDVDEFALGFPPRLWKKLWHGTWYTINLLPLGGFVKIKGEDGSHRADPKSFASKPASIRLFIICAGVLMNVILAFFLFTVISLLGAPTMVTDDQEFSRFARLSDQRLLVLDVLPASPASQVGILRGDVLIAIDGTDLASVEQLRQALNSDPDKPVNISIRRNGTSITTTITPAPLDGLEGVGVGIASAQVATIKYPWFIAWWHGLKQTGSSLWLIISGFAALFSQLLQTGSVAGSVAGPVGIAVLTGEAARLGLVYLLQFTALLSLNLALINLIPFPALDGSRALAILIEKIRRKPFHPNKEKWVYIIGFSTLILLMLAITVQDLRTYGGHMMEGFFSFFQ